MNSRSLVIAMVLGFALALVAFGVTVVVGNSRGWWEPVKVNNVVKK